MTCEETGGYDPWGLDMDVQLPRHVTQSPCPSTQVASSPPLSSAPRTAELLPTPIFVEEDEGTPLLPAKEPGSLFTMQVVPPPKGGISEEKVPAPDPTPTSVGAGSWPGLAGYLSQAVVPQL